jgi:hypothetical protein
MDGGAGTVELKRREAAPLRAGRAAGEGARNEEDELVGRSTGRRRRTGLASASAGRKMSERLRKC